jgi:hypothetical protein
MRINGQSADPSSKNSTCINRLVFDYLSKYTDPLHNIHSILTDSLGARLARAHFAILNSNYSKGCNPNGHLGAIGPQGEISILHSLDQTIAALPYPCFPDTPNAIQASIQVVSELLLSALDEEEA